MAPTDTELAVDDYADQEDEPGFGSTLGSVAKSNEADSLFRLVREDTADDDGLPTVRLVDDKDATPTFRAADDVEVEDTGFTEEDDNDNVRHREIEAECFKYDREATGRGGSIRVAQSIAGVMGAADEGSSRKTVF